jgi:hypothetical protein
MCCCESEPELIMYASPPPCLFPFSQHTISRLQRLHQRQREPPDQHVGYLTDNVGVCAPHFLGKVW